MFNFKLGKLPARVDSRTLKLRTILPTLPIVPPTYDVDSQFTTMVDNNMYLNNKLGDCVIAARAHMTLRFEEYEQRTLIPITDTEVKTEYFKETGGSDSGLNMLDSLNQWRQNGWLVGGKIYKIHAFASINWNNHAEVMAAIYLFNGIVVGVQWPNSGFDQFNKGEILTVVTPDGGIAGGHCIYGKAYLPLPPKLKVVGYNEVGPIYYTWGKPIQATWEWHDKYVDEAYVVIDERDSWIPDTENPLNIPLLEQYLAQIGATPSQQITISILSLPKGTVGKYYSANLRAAGGTLPYNWTVSQGTLPNGLFMDSSGAITGNPSIAGSSKITFVCTDAVGNASGVILPLTINKKRKCIFGGN